MLAIVSAMLEEITGVIQALSDVKVAEFGRRQFHTGRLHGVEVVAVFSRYGKVAAAATVTQLLTAYPVTRPRLVANRSSASMPATSQKRRHWSSLPTASTNSPSEVVKVS